MIVEYGYLFTIFTRKETDTPQYPEYIDEMFPRYYMHNAICNNKHNCVTRPRKLNDHSFKKNNLIVRLIKYFYVKIKYFLRIARINKHSRVKQHRRMDIPY